MIKFRFIHKTQIIRIINGETHFPKMNLRDTMYYSVVILSSLIHLVSEIKNKVNDKYNFQFGFRFFEKLFIMSQNLKYSSSDIEHPCME